MRKIIIKNTNKCKKGNISLLKEIGIAESNGVIGILARNSELTDFAHAQLKCGQKSNKTL